MNFIASFLVTTGICVVLGAGILLAAHGSGFWLLILGLAAFLGLFIKYGCLGH
jgi:hypothetical protein